MNLACPVLLLSALPLGASPQGELRLPAIFSDHMVLQRETEAPVWGWSAASQTVRARGDWMDEAVETRADASGEWRLTLPTPPAGGPHRVSIEADTRIDLEDVWSGEVWVCSGQSNMEWPLHDTEGGAAAGAVELPRLRFFDVPHTIGLAPRADTDAEWRPCTPESSRDFSAVGYYFALALREHIDVPIGLVGANWGGTRVEAWTSSDSLRKRAGFPEALERLAQMHERADELEAERRAKDAAWWAKLYSHAAWQAAELDTSEWSTVAVPGVWDATELGAHDGAVWYRRQFELPADWVGSALRLELGPIDDLDTTWLNGAVVGEHHGRSDWWRPRQYTIPAANARAGTNTLAVCVVDTGGAGGFAGETEQLRVFPEGREDEALSLAGEWLHRRGKPLAELEPMPASATVDQHAPSVLFNGMIAPLLPFAMRGVIWYQGESNRTRAAEYRELFPGMIADWRSHWGRAEFPFYFVQIAPFAYSGDTGEAAQLREAQQLALRVPNTGMAVTMDIGNPDDIHPRNKLDVGRRLARWALARTYGVEGIVVSGPLYRQMLVEDGAIVLRFDHSEGLAARGGEPSHLTIAGADRAFVPAEGRIEGDTLRVWSAAVPEPVAVRYAWGAADQPNLFNGAGLPASSFRTDDW